MTLMLQTLDAFQAGKSLEVQTIVVTPVSGMTLTTWPWAPTSASSSRKAVPRSRVAVYASELTLQQKQEKKLALQVV